MSVTIIAEAGVNHNGSLAMAKQLIDAAADAGADAVKFQTFKSEKLVSRFAPKAKYQEQTTGSGSQLEMLRRLELSEDDHRSLLDYSQRKSIQFLSTPFDHESLEFLVGTLNLPRIKIGSGDLTNAPVLLAVARSGKPLILSTGMSTLQEVESALQVLAFGYAPTLGKPSLDAFRKAFASGAGRDAMSSKVVLLHCTTEYPAPFDEVNLRAMDTLATTFGLPVGFSDHTPGIAVSIAAVARGASVIEKHFTLDRNLPGPDHRASLQPDELKAMVLAIRQVEKSLGSSTKAPSPSEIGNKAVARKSLVAAREIRKGELFTDENLTVKRPGSGISPSHFWEYLGKPANRDFSADELLEGLEGKGTAHD